MPAESPHICHWDDVPARASEPPYAGSWRDLGRATGSVTSGLRMASIEAGNRTTPPHVHGAEEEIFYVTSGSGLAWVEGETFSVARGDTIVHLPQRGAHTLVAGPQGLKVLVYGTRRQPEACFLPRAKTAWIGPTWTAAGEGPHPFVQDALAGSLDVPPASDRPAFIVSLQDVPAVETRRGRFAMVSRPVSAAAGSVSAGLRHVTLDPMHMGYPLHCHSTEEEIFAVVEGEGTCLLGSEQIAVRAGTIITRPAGTGVSHGFRAGSCPLTYLAFGERSTADMCWYPESRKVSFRGLGVIGRLEPVEYWDGEGDEAQANDVSAG